MNTFAVRLSTLRERARRSGVDPAAMVLPAEGIVPGAGVDLHYLEWPGPTAAPLILFVHGGGLNAHSFAVVGSLLSTVGRCVAVDLRGHGDSEWAPAPDKYGTEVNADDIDAVVTAHGGGPVIVVGQSLGGMSALVWAARHPDSLVGLVVVDAGPTLDDGVERIGDVVGVHARFADIEQAHALVSGRPASDRPDTSGVASNLRWDDEGYLTWKYDPAQFAPAGSDIALGDALRTAARRVTCPTLVLRGSRSAVFSNAGAEELAELLPNGRWQCIPHAGHNVQISNPGALAHSISTFMTDLGCGVSARPAVERQQL